VCERKRQKGWVYIRLFVCKCVLYVCSNVSASAHARACVCTCETERVCARGHTLAGGYVCLYICVCLVRLYLHIYNIYVCVFL